MSIENLKSKDPFEDSEDTGQAQNYIHLRIQQRNGRKTLTTLQGLTGTYDHKKILKVFKKDFSTNGTIVKDDEMGDVIQVQGDQRNKIADFLQNELGISAKNIKVHGF